MPGLLGVRARRRQYTSIAAITLAGLVAGCSDATPRADGSSVATVNPSGARVPEALNFRAPLVGGGEFDGADFAGRAVVFWFWAPT